MLTDISRTLINSLRDKFHYIFLRHKNKNTFIPKRKSIKKKTPAFISNHDFQFKGNKSVVIGYWCSIASLLSRDKNVPPAQTMFLPPRWLPLPPPLPCTAQIIADNVDSVLLAAIFLWQLAWIALPFRLRSFFAGMLLLGKWFLMLTGNKCIWKQ